MRFRRRALAEDHADEAEAMSVEQGAPYPLGPPQGRFAENGFQQAVLLAFFRASDALAELNPEEVVFVGAGVPALLPNFRDGEHCRIRLHFSFPLSG